MAKVKVATVWLEACAGCHMSFLDIDERLVDLVDLVDGPARRCCRQRRGGKPVPPASSAFPDRHRRCQM